MHAPDDLLRADALGDAREPLVHEALDAAALSGRLKERKDNNNGNCIIAETPEARTNE